MSVYDIPAQAEFLRQNFVIDWLEPQFLDQKRLDYSLDILQAIEDYLAGLYDWYRSRPDPSFQALAQERYFTETVFWVGAYICETLRRQDPDLISCETYDRYLAANPGAADTFGDKPDAANLYVVIGKNGFATLPNNKIIKRLTHGPEDNIASYGAAMLAELRR